MKKENIISIIKLIGILILSCGGVFLLNNIRTIINILLKSNNRDLVFCSFTMVMSLIIFLFYIYKVKKKNKYLSSILIMMLTFYNICKGVFYSADINTFFLLYFILLIFSFRVYIKNENFSASLIASFSILIIVVMLIGLLGMLKVVKYLILLYAIYNIIFLYVNRQKLEINTKLNNFINKELLMFTILFMIAIVGGVGRFIHVYDEYSHWAYDAKAVIHYDKFSTSKEIMSKTRSYAPILTTWYYITAQYSNGFNESNLYISLAIFVSVYLMSVIINKKNNKYAYFTVICAYLSYFIFENVYSYDTLYADLAFSVVFGASLISIFETNFNKKLLRIPLLVILTLIKPSGCTASFVVLFIMMCKYFVDEKDKKVLPIIKSFIKNYWQYILITIGCFVGWHFYVAVTSNMNNEFFTVDIRPASLYSDLLPKLNKDFIVNFINLIFKSFDDVIIFGGRNVSLYQFIVIILILIYFVINKINNNSSKSFKYVIILLSAYIIFFMLTVFSIFYSFSYYEASIFASFARYVNAIHVAFIILAMYLINQLYNAKNNTSKIIIIVFISLTLLTNCNKAFYFVLNTQEKITTHEISDTIKNEFAELNKKTPENSKVFVIDQEEKNGIMAMWYARYYAFPRKVNASSAAIAWKIKTDKNKDDLQDWGLTKETFIDELKNDKFDYIFLYSLDDELLSLLKDNFVKYNNKSKVYRIIYKDSEVMFESIS